LGPDGTAGKCVEYAEAYVKKNGGEIVGSGDHHWVTTENGMYDPTLRDNLAAWDLPFEDIPRGTKFFTPEEHGPLIARREAQVSEFATKAPEGYVDPFSRENGTQTGTSPAEPLPLETEAIPTETTPPRESTSISEKTAPPKTTPTGTTPTEPPTSPNQNGVKPPVVTAEASVNGSVFSDVNQTARVGADAQKPTLIADRIAAKSAARGKELPNGNMATAHAEVGSIQQAFDAGVTAGADMQLTVTGQPVCGYCLGDIAAMADKAGLKSLTVYEKATGNTLFWEKGMKSLQRVKK
jgi:hypothetical protein